MLAWELYSGLQHARAGRIFHTVVDSLSRCSDADAAVVVDAVANRIAVVAADSKAPFAFPLRLYTPSRPPLRLFLAYVLETSGQDMSVQKGLFGFSKEENKLRREGRSGFGNKYLL